MYYRKLVGLNNKRIIAMRPLQVQYRGLFATAKGIISEEGLHKLWGGVTPALYRHVVYR